MSAALLLAPQLRAQQALTPCNTPDPGNGIYERWSRDVSIGQMLAPRAGGMTARGGFDVIIHFHGHEPARKEFVPVGGGIVLVGIDLGTGSAAYANAFASPRVFEELLESVRVAMAKRRGRERAHIRRLALSSWSAGYGAIDQILRQPAGRKVDSIILLDSLYAGYEDGTDSVLEIAGLEPFIRFAALATRGRRFMYQTHSQIETYGYATTREVAQYVVKRVGGKLRHAKRRDRLGLRLVERFDRRGYHVRGYHGNDKAEHCGHIGVLRDVVKVHLRPRWRTPRGFVPRAE